MDTSDSDSDLVYDLSRWWCVTWQKVQPDAEPPVFRYYRLCLQQDLWEQWELLRCWGRIGQKPSRERRERVDSPEAAEAIRKQVQKTRRQHRYVPVEAPLVALDLANCTSEDTGNPVLRGNLNKGQIEKPVFLMDEGNKGKENAQKKGF